MKVVFPAPFGPSSPMAARMATVQVPTLSNAFCWPKTFDNSFVSITTGADTFAAPLCAGIFGMSKQLRWDGWDDTAGREDRWDLWDAWDQWDGDEGGADGNLLDPNMEFVPP